MVGVLSQGDGLLLRGGIGSLPSENGGAGSHGREEPHWMVRKLVVVLRRKLDFCRQWPNCLRSMTGMALARFEMRRWQRRSMFMPGILALGLRQWLSDRRNNDRLFITLQTRR